MCFFALQLGFLYLRQFAATTLIALIQVARSGLKNFTDGFIKALSK